jgi:transcriptional regulator with XRE-family HTH domain
MIARNYVKLDVAMDQARMTQVKLSKRTGVSVARIRSFQHGHLSPRPEEAARIAEAIGRDPKFLFPEVTR